MVGIAHNGRPRHGISLQKVNKTEIRERIKRIVARKSDKVGFCASNELIHRLLRKLADMTKRLTVVALNVGKVKYDKIPVRLLFNGTGKFS